jgi:ATP-dependent Lhr-like helicase
MSPSALFHPVVVAWFERSFRAPTATQSRAWPAIKAGRNVLIAAPTGSGKTLAAFMTAIDDLIRQGLNGALPDETQVVYVSPLKAIFETQAAIDPVLARSPPPGWASSSRLRSRRAECH